MPALDGELAELNQQLSATKEALVEPAEREIETFEEPIGLGSESLRPSVRMQLEMRRLRLLVQKESLMKAVAERSVLWPDPTIAVCWEDSADDFSTERSWVQDAVEQSWASHSAVSFGGWGQCDGGRRGIHIAVDNQGEAQTSGLGVELDGVSAGLTLRFDFSDWNRSCASHRETCIRFLAVHEFGHALGFTHEQNRPEAEGWCADLAQGHSGSWSITIYDEFSIMNYCSPSYLRDVALSGLDIEAIQIVYGIA